MALFRPALSSLLLVACGGGGGFPDAPGPDAAVPPGTMSLQWKVTDLMGNEIGCDRIKAQTVTLTLRNRSVAGASTEVFTCQTAAGTTPKLTPGTYDVLFELSGNVGELATATKQMDVVVMSNQNTPLMPVTFALDDTGKLDLTISSGNAMGNCALGAGITGTTITLVHAGNQTCEPVVFTLSTGGTYTVNCGAPVEAGCIDNTTHLTVDKVPADGYQIHVRGKKAALDCYSNDDQLTVPPLGKTLMQQLNMLHSSAQGC